MTTTTPVTFTKRGITVVLYMLAANTQPRARDLYHRMMGSWGHRPDQERVTVKLNEYDLALLGEIGASAYLNRHVLKSGWRVTYRHPTKGLEVTVETRTKPPKRRTFRIGRGKHRLIAVAATRFGGKKKHTTKEAIVPTRTRKAKKAVEDDELDELEGLEDLDDLEDLEDEEEPEDEDEDEGEEEEEAPKSRRKAPAKKAPAKKPAAKTTRKKAAPVEDEGDEEDDEDEDEAPAPKRSAKSKAPAAKAKTAAKSNGKSNLPAARELPKGQYGPEQIAEMVGGDCDGRYVRIFLRKNYEREDGSRWAFPRKEAQTIAREIKTERKG